MASSGNVGMLDQERLKQITQDMDSWSGLSLAAIGAGLAGGDVANIWLKETHWGNLIGIATLLLGAVAAFIYLPRYYRRRFGYIERRIPTKPNWFAELAVRQVAVISMAGLLIIVLVEMAGEAFPVRTSLGPIVFYISILLAALYQRNINWWFAGPLIVMVPAIALLTFFPFLVSYDARQIDVWRDLVKVSRWFGITVLGVFGHIRLVRALPLRTEEADHE